MTTRRPLGATSLTDSFNEMGKAFEAANPGVHVKCSYDSSSTLANQANAGAPADLFASADEANMQRRPTRARPSTPKRSPRSAWRSSWARATGKAASFPL